MTSDVELKTQSITTFYALVAIISTMLPLAHYTRKDSKPQPVKIPTNDRATAVIDGGQSAVSNRTEDLQR